MESNSHPKRFGKKLRNIRKSKKMSQVEFYKYLFPETSSSEEVIKKKMNKVENGKQKSVDLDMFLRICDKCDISADYLIDREKDYSNQDRKIAGEYTGLSDKAIKQLHEWSEAQKIEVEYYDEIALIEEGEHDESYWKNLRKKSAILFLEMFNLLFEDGKQTITINGHKHDERFSNLSIIHSIYMICAGQPKLINGHLTKEYKEEKFIYSDRVDDCVQIDATRVTFEDEENVLFPLDVEAIMHQYAWKRLERAIDLLRMQIQEKNKN